MSDYLLEISRNPFAKSLVKRLRLPVPMPEPLVRKTGAWGEGLLQDLAVAIGGNGTVAEVLERIVTAAGGEVVTTHDPERRFNGLVFDATGLTSTTDLGRLYDFIKPRLSSLKN